MATKLIFEILEEAASKKTNEEKISVLQKNSSMALKDVLRGTIDSTIQWNLPGGEPPYTACEEHNCPANLLREHKKFKYFVKGLHESESLPSFKREKVFFGIDCSSQIIFKKCSASNGISSLLSFNEGT